MVTALRTTYHEAPKRRSAGFSVWVSLAIIVAVVGAASLAGACVCEPRENGARNGIVIASHAL